MQDWSINDEQPPPRWLVYGLAAASVVALVCLLLMVLWLVAVYIVPNRWIP